MHVLEYIWYFIDIINSWFYMILSQHMMKLVNHCFSACLCQLKLFLDTLRHAKMTTPGISFLFFLSRSLSPLLLLLYMRNACARPRINRRGDNSTGCKLSCITFATSCLPEYLQIAKMPLLLLLLLHFSRFLGSRRGRQWEKEGEIPIACFLECFSVCHLQLIA